MKTIKVAYGSIPKDGGTYTFYRNQRPALQKLGYELICVSVGAHEATLWNAKFADEGCVLLAAKEKKLKKQSEIFVDWCVQNQIAIVIGVNSEAIISAIPHLPTDIKVVSRAANAYHEGYAYATHALSRVTRVVALVPLLHKELIQNYNVPEQIIEVIPNGVDLSKFNGIRETNNKQDLIKILFVGRLEHNQKGVLHIPHILRELEKLNVSYHLIIVGKGKHETKLRKELEPFSKESYTFMGTLDSENVIKQLYEHDVFLFTSHFEGCPNALLEAMAAGCIPVSWKLDGITDFIIEDEKTGFLHKINDYDSMAKSIGKLFRDTELTKKMSNQVSEIARERFSNEVCAENYAGVFAKVLHQDSIGSPKEWKYFSSVKAQKSRYSFIPKSVKDIIKKLLQFE